MTSGPDLFSFADAVSSARIADKIEGKLGSGAGDARRARVFTVPAGQPFLACLVRALLDGNLPAPGGAPPDPLSLPDTTLLLPTRRAMRGIQDAFLAATGGRAMLLPQIRPIAEGDEELTLLAGLAGLAGNAVGAADLDPAIGEMDRRLALAALVLAWSKSMRGGDGGAVAAGASTPAQAAKLAADLARLMDMVETEGKSLDNLADLVPEEFSDHWQATIEFLRIVTEHWPQHLAAQSLMSPKDRQNRTILAEAERIRDFPPDNPLIVAGVTGSIPATAELMRAVLALPNAAIVLPGLDLDLDEASWQAIAPVADDGSEPGAVGHPEHPQYGLKRLLDRLGLTRADIAVLPGAEGSSGLAARRRLVSEAMRPAATTGLWRGYIDREGAAGSAARAELITALDGLSLIEAPGAQDEAEVIALILREAAETPGRTAALVSPDRLLARRVAVRLESWGIRVDDSAGRPFAKTVPGAFLDLIVTAIENDFAPADVLALLKHPLTRLGLTPFEVRRAARALEIAAFRMPYLGRGLDGVAAALAKAEDLRRDGTANRPQQRLFPEDMAGAADIVRRLEAAFAPLTALYADRESYRLRELAAAHLAVAEALVAEPAPLTPDKDGSAPRSELYVGEAGQTAALLFDGLKREHALAPIVPAADYADLYRGLVAAENVRPKIPLHPRLFIWGPLEARLQQADIVVLGSLNDGTWPESADPGPWLNRPMRQRLGLPSPEERIGHAAHDFASLLSSPRVILTRAMKRDGVPTVESRWLLRLQALLAGLDLSSRLQPAEPWLAWAVNRDEAPRLPPIGAPAPRPPVALRPRKLSVSNVETWIANPYAIFARHILKLDAMPQLGVAPDASLRGSVIHEALAKFAAAYPDHLPPAPGAELTEIVREVIKDWTGDARVAAFWLPRLERFAEWFGETEAERRRDVARTVAELSGRLVIDGSEHGAFPGGPFTLTARADRIDVTSGSGIVITDYKSGGYPNDKAVNTGEKPQLPLEAAIAATTAGGFPGISPGRVDVLRYIRASGGDPPGEQHTVRCDSVEALAEKVLADFAGLVARFDDEATPYASARRARFNYDYDDYAHLARVAEWSALEANEPGDAGPAIDEEEAA